MKTILILSSLLLIVLTRQPASTYSGNLPDEYADGEIIATANYWEDDGYDESVGTNLTDFVYWISSFR